MNIRVKKVSRSRVRERLRLSGPRTGIVLVYSLVSDDDSKSTGFGQRDTERPGAAVAVQ